MAKINIEQIAQALESTLVSEQSEKAKGFDWRRESILTEFRTIGFHLTRQTGKTTWIVDRVAKEPKTSLVLLSNPALEYDFKRKLEVRHGEVPEGLRIIAGKAYERGFQDWMRVHPIDRIYIDDSLFYFSQWRRQKTMAALLANFTLSNDMIIYQIN